MTKHGNAHEYDSPTSTPSWWERCGKNQHVPQNAPPSCPVNDHWGAAMKLTSKGKGDGASGKYPMNDKKHARLAKSGASRAEHVGNISKATEKKIDAKADRMLKK